MTNVIINFQIEGLHCWSTIPNTLSEVGFLKNPHRHMFHICCKIDVSHDDRAIEIIMLKRKVIHKLNNLFFDDAKDCLDFGSMSCEMIARLLMKEFSLKYCSVLEDGENGAEIFE